MGQLFSNYFVAAHQQVGDFRAVKVGSQVIKNGGNVASHFLTTDGRVIHSVTGPVSADTLLSEARWALDAYTAVQGKPLAIKMRQLAWSHARAAQSAASNQDRQVHELLAQRPLQRLSVLFDEVFEDILGQRVSKAGPRLALASKGLQLAQESGRPILFVLHEGRDKSQWQWPASDGSRAGLEYAKLTRQLVAQYVVIVLPLRDAPALSQLTKQPPFEAPSRRGPLLVIARSDGSQLSSAAGWQAPDLVPALARGWVRTLEENPPSVRQLTRATRLLEDVDPALARRTRDLAIQLRQNAA